MTYANLENGHRSELSWGLALIMPYGSALRVMSRGKGAAYTLLESVGILYQRGHKPSVAAGNMAGERPTDKNGLVDPREFDGGWSIDEIKAISAQHQANYKPIRRTYRSFASPEKFYDYQAKIRYRYGRTF
ncbi:hypothetical protein EYZ11_004701 [Aspergillus tanneri]|uniref:Uncharacterized protein n=1 Tax=Aspergillus tanneri TaxID=1220188 RepID=A0A4S3JQQ8_9EURO|nr:hypothetical protein EYZ11_004701 [Aspergillus tanneri]